MQPFLSLRQPNRGLPPGTGALRPSAGSARRWASAALLVVALTLPAQFGPALDAQAHPPAPPAPALQCLTDPELMAEAAARHLVEQRYRALLCQTAHGAALQKEPGVLPALTRDVARKFEFQFSRYRELRKGRFQRIFGDGWERAMKGERILKLWRLRATIPHLEEQECGRWLRDTEKTFDGDWRSLRKNLDRRAEAMRPTMLMCPIPIEGLYPDPEKEGAAKGGPPSLPGFPGLTEDKLKAPPPQPPRTTPIPTQKPPLPGFDRIFHPRPPEPAGVAAPAKKAPRKTGGSHPG